MSRRSTAMATVAATDFSALIAERAYFKAEQRGFEPGHELQDWLEAERELAATDTSVAEVAVTKPKKAPARPKAGAVKKLKKK
jgi:hypothetical protein